VQASCAASYCEFCFAYLGLQVQVNDIKAVARRGTRLTPRKQPNVGQRWNREDVRKQIADSCHFRCKITLGQLLNSGEVGFVESKKKTFGRLYMIK
jgi:hypothetical protein